MGDGAGSTTSGGVYGKHADRAKLPLYVAPTDQQDFNALRLILLPIACWRLEDLRFDFDSSFVRPEAAEEMAALAGLRKEHPGAGASIFGHADPVGDDDYNKKLSGRRAIAIYALLTRDVARWEKLYSNKLGGDDWGVRSIQWMLTTVGFDPGHVDGKMGGITKQAVKDYQTSKGLSVDGDPGPDTRKALFGDYMDAVCKDGDGKPYTLDPKADFLSQSADGGLRGDVQGCSEFNLMVVFSQDEDQAYQPEKKHSERDAANLPNRRVLVFLFPPGAKIDLDKWPCPGFDDGPATCKAAFWPDGDTRRAPGDKHRAYVDTKDTMACRFYDRMARRSPCEVSRGSITLRLLDINGDFIPDAPYRVTLSSGEVREGTATDDGWLVEANVETPESVHVEWGYPTEHGITDDDRAKRALLEGPYAYQLDVMLFTEDDAPDEDQAARHLANLGYSQDRTFLENLITFQRQYEVFPALGELNDDTKKALKMVDDEGLTRDEFIEKWAGEKGGNS
jgi:hypothetical protein